jgi:predicted metalloprotease with PDZ domain
MQIHEGDYLVQANGVDLEAMPHAAIVALLTLAGPVTLVVQSPPATASTSSSALSRQATAATPAPAATPAVTQKQTPTVAAVTAPSGTPAELAAAAALLRSRVVVVTRAAVTAPLGLTLHAQDGLVRVTNITPDSPVARTHHVFVGDALVAANGKSLVGVPEERVVQLLYTAGRTLTLVFLGGTPPATPAAAAARLQAAAERSVALIRSHAGQPLGLSLAPARLESVHGGADPTGVASTGYGVRVQAVAPESPAARAHGLHAGDHVLAVNGVGLAPLPFAAAAALLADAVGDTVVLRVHTPAAFPVYHARTVTVHKGEARQAGFIVGSDVHGRGARVFKVTPSSPAAAAGLRHGDHVVACNGALLVEMQHDAIIALIKSTDPLVLDVVADDAPVTDGLPPLPTITIAPVDPPAHLPDHPSVVEAGLQAMAAVAIAVAEPVASTDAEQAGAMADAEQAAHVSGAPGRRTVSLKKTESSSRLGLVLKVRVCVVA